MIGSSDKRCVVRLCCLAEGLSERRALRRFLKIERAEMHDGEAALRFGKMRDSRVSGVVWGCRGVEVRQWSRDVKCTDVGEEEEDGRGSEW
jgi:hypothetical protein